MVIESLNNSVREPASVVTAITGKSPSQVSAQNPELEGLRYEPIVGGAPTPESDLTMTMRSQLESVDIVIIPV
ncbi:hypothetical protein DID77_01235 [Candidatus Marinamargulisbacteria bacterium SCGC AG-439-L15]|nr:hypothetical protein DID77_01235 [Candidatus Marinamargulisbacteria bacterium SCGC AG-439-L15]